VGPFACQLRVLATNVDVARNLGFEFVSNLDVDRLANHEISCAEAKRAEDEGSGACCSSRGGSAGSANHIALLSRLKRNLRVMPHDRVDVQLQLSILAEAAILVNFANRRGHVGASMDHNLSVDGNVVNYMKSDLVAGMNVS